MDEAKIPEPLHVGAMLWHPIARGTWAMNVGDGALVKCVEDGRGSPKSRAVTIERMPGLHVVSRTLGSDRRLTRADIEAAVRGEPVKVSAIDATVVGYALLPADAIGDGWTLVRSVVTDVDDAVLGTYGGGE